MPPGEPLTSVRRPIPITAAGNGAVTGPSYTGSMEAAISPPPPGVEDRDLQLARAALVVQRVLAVGFVSAVAGLVIGGVGGRIAMRVSALAAQDWAQGRLTDAGARVGEITVGGTIALILLGGGAAFLLGAALVAVGSELLPRRPWLRSALGAAVFLALAGPLVVDPANVDFVILEPVALNVAMFAGLVALFGAVTVPAVAWCERWIDRRLHIRLTGWSLPVVLALLGAVLAYGTAWMLTSPEFCGCADPSPLTALLLAGAFAATGALWVRRIVTGKAGWPTVRAIGVLSLSAAMFIGSMRLIDHVGTLI